MAEHWLDRQTMLIGAQASKRLGAARVAVVGLGGVGGAAAEALARSGVGNLFLLDRDVFEPSNLNRQILATTAVIGCPKSAAARERVLSINPLAQVTARQNTFSENDDGGLVDFAPGWVIDAVDSVSAKLVLIERCKEHGIHIISSMGTGNRLEADFAIGGLAQSAASGCPLARVMRKELKKRGIDDLTALYCKSPPIKTGARVPGSVSYVPPIAGFMLAGYVIRAIIQDAGT